MGKYHSCAYRYEFSKLILFHERGPEIMCVPWVNKWLIITKYYNLQNKDLLPSKDKYKQAIRSSLYISSSTKPDITVSTHIQSRRWNNPRQKD